METNQCMLVTTQWVAQLLQITKRKTKVKENFETNNATELNFVFNSDLKTTLNSGDFLSFPSP